VWVTSAKKLQEIKNQEAESEQLKAELERKLETRRKQQVSVWIKIDDGVLPVAVINVCSQYNADNYWYNLYTVKYIVMITIVLCKLF